MTIDKDGLASLLERLEDEAQRLSGHSLDRGSVDAGIASNLAHEAADAITTLTSRAQAAEASLASAREALERIAKMEGTAGFEAGPEHTMTINGEVTKGLTRQGAFANDVARRAIRALKELR